MYRCIGLFLKIKIIISDIDSQCTIYKDNLTLSCESIKLTPFKNLLDHEIKYIIIKRFKLKI